MSQEEEQYIIILDLFCFKGKRHQKRLTGIKLFPIDILFDYKESNGIDLVTIITQMFKTRFITKT